MFPTHAVQIKNSRARFLLEDFVQVLSSVSRKNELLDAVDDDMVQTVYATFDEKPATDLELVKSGLLRSLQELLLLMNDFAIVKTIY